MHKKPEKSFHSIEVIFCIKSTSPPRFFGFLFKFFFLEEIVSQFGGNSASVKYHRKLNKWIMDFEFIKQVVLKLTVWPSWLDSAAPCLRIHLLTSQSHLFCRAALRWAEYRLGQFVLGCQSCPNVQFGQLAFRCTQLSQSGLGLLS